MAETTLCGGGRIRSHSVSAGKCKPGGLKEKDDMWVCRSHLAELLQVTNPSRISLGANVTYALNEAIQGFPSKRRRGLNHTGRAQCGVLRPLYRLEKKRHHSHRICSGGARWACQLKTWWDYLERYHPRMVVFIHASNVTGAVNDAQTFDPFGKRAIATVILDAAMFGYCTCPPGNLGH